MKHISGGLLAMGLLFAVAPAYAQQSPGSSGSSQSGPNSVKDPLTTCQAELVAADEAVKGATDPAKKAAATQEIAMAKDQMAKSQLNACLLHANNAVKLAK